LSKFSALRSLIESPELTFLMEAHNGLSAKITEEAGFAGIWASGLTISASLGLRDNNEASWSQVLDVVEFINDATTLPVLLDGDTGYGNFNTFRLLVRKLCRHGIAGVCIEDKVFPKANSFIDKAQELVRPDEFAGKIRAARDTQTNDDFVLVARTEALICGESVSSALRRADQYAAAGADAILIHSKKPTAVEVLEFARLWSGEKPLIIVPTKYPDTPTDLFRDAGISTVIWANHNLRASITAMRDVSRRIHAMQSLHGVEGRIAGVDDIFQLVDNAELEAAENIYLPRASGGRNDEAAAVRDISVQAVDERGVV